MGAEQKEDFVQKVSASVVEMIATSAALPLGLKLGKKAVKATKKVLKKQTKKIRKVAKKTAAAAKPTKTKKGKKKSAPA